MEGSETPKSPEEELQEFQNEIQAIKNAEMEKKNAWEERDRTGQAYDPHFDDIEPLYLSPAERQAHEAVKAGQLTIDEFNQLRWNAEDAARKRFADSPEKSSAEKSVSAFWQYLANKMAARHDRRQRTL